MSHQKKVVKRFFELSARGDKEGCHALILQGVDVNSRDRIGSTALHYACLNNKVELALTLCDWGSEINARDKDLETALHIASHNGSEQLIKGFILRGAEIDPKDKDGWTPLNRAICEGNQEVACLLIRRGANVNSVDRFGSTILHQAAAHMNGIKDISIIPALSRSTGCMFDTNALNREGFTPLCLAYRHSSFPLANVLISKMGCSSDDVGGPNGQTALHVALSRCDEAVALHLIENEGANLMATDSNGWTSLHHACARGFSACVSAILNRNQGLIDQPDKEGDRPIHIAVYYSHEGIVSILINKGADLRSVDGEGCTALFWAAQSSDHGITKLLLGQGCVVYASILDLQGSVHFACQQGQKRIVETFIALGLDISLRNNAGDTILHSACASNDCGVVSILCQFGADYEIANKAGDTPLHVCCRSGGTDIAKLLLSIGADPNLKNGCGYTSFEIAVKCGHLNLFSLLCFHRGEEHLSGLFARIFGVKKETFLHLAAAHGWHKLVKFMIAHGALATAKNVNGNTPLHLACMNSKPKVVEVLLRENPSLADMANAKGLTPRSMAVQSNDCTVLIQFQERIKQSSSSSSPLNDVLCSTSLENEKQVYAYIKEVVRRGDVDFKSLNTSGQSLLHVAFERHLYNILTLLICHGADVNVLNTQQNSVLHILCSSLKTDKDRGNDRFRKQNIDLVLGLIKAGAFWAEPNNSDISSIEILFESREYKLLLACLDVGVDINFKYTGKNTLLHLACSWQCKGRYDKNCVEFIEGLHERGAKYILANNDGDLPIHVALKGCCFPLIEKLLALGVQLSLKTTENLDFLQFLCSMEVGDFERWHIAWLESSRQNLTDMIQFFLARGVDIDGRDLINNTDMINSENQSIRGVKMASVSPTVAAAKSNNMAMLYTLVDLGADVNASDSMGNAALHHVCGLDPENIRAVEFLLTKGVSINAKNKFLSTALHVACACKNVTLLMLTLLIEHGAEVNSRDKSGDSPVYFLARNGLHDCAKLLISKGANVNFRASDGSSLLYCATRDHQLAWVQYLIENGADTNFVKSGGYTLLIQAVLQNSADLVRFLLVNGSSVEGYDHSGSTALVASVRYGLVDMINILLGAGANINQTDKRGASPLVWACREGFPEIALSLIRSGAEADPVMAMATSRGSGAKNSAFYTAVRNGHEDVALQLLLGKAIFDVEDKNGHSTLHWAIENKLARVETVLRSRGLTEKQKLKKRTRPAGRFVPPTTKRDDSIPTSLSEAQDLSTAAMRETDGAVRTFSEDAQTRGSQGNNSELPFSHRLFRGRLTAEPRVDDQPDNLQQIKDSGILAGLMMAPRSEMLEKSSCRRVRKASSSSHDYIDPAYAELNGRANMAYAEESTDDESDFGENDIMSVSDTSFSEEFETTVILSGPHRGAHSEIVLGPGPDPLSVRPPNVPDGPFNPTSTTSSSASARSKGRLETETTDSGTFPLPTTSSSASAHSKDRLETETTDSAKHAFISTASDIKVAPPLNNIFGQGTSLRSEYVQTGYVASICESLSIGDRGLCVPSLPGSEVDASRKRGRTIMSKQSVADEWILAEARKCRKDENEKRVAERTLLDKYEDGLYEGLDVSTPALTALSLRTIRDLGYTATFISRYGYSALEMKEAGYSAFDIWGAGYSISFLRKIDFVPNEGLDIFALIDSKGPQYLNQKDEFGWAPIHWASLKGLLGVLKALLLRGADVNAADDTGETPLHKASDKGHLDVVRVLIESGAHWSKTTKLGNIPLHFACRRGHSEVAMLLVSHGSDIFFENGSGLSALAACQHDSFKRKLLNAATQYLIQNKQEAKTFSRSVFSERPASLTLEVLSGGSESKFCSADQVEEGKQNFVDTQYDSFSQTFFLNM
jgi:ankyrin repeat protein